MFFDNIEIILLNKLLRSHNKLFARVIFIFYEVRFSQIIRKTSKKSYEAVIKRYKLLTLCAKRFILDKYFN